MADMGSYLDRIKTVNWRRAASYANPQSIKDLDVFLDKLPARVGMTGLSIAMGMWVIAGLSLLVVYTKSVNLQTVRKQITQAEAMRPSVPSVTYKPVAPAEVKTQVEKMKNIYKTLTITESNGTVNINASTTRDFPAWRAAIGDLTFGGSTWRLQTKSFCAGRECKGAPLQASLVVQQLDISVSTQPAGQQKLGTEQLKGVLNATK